MFVKLSDYYLSVLHRKMGTSREGRISLGDVTNIYNPGISIYTYCNEISLENSKFYFNISEAYF